MPLKKARKGASKKARAKVVSQNIHEFSGGKTFARTKRKFGAKRARKQAVAVALSSMRGGKKRRR